MLVLHHQTKPLLPAFGSAVVIIEPDDLKGLLQPKGFYNPIVPLGHKPVSCLQAVCYKSRSLPSSKCLSFSWELSGVMNSGTVS